MRSPSPIWGVAVAIGVGLVGTGLNWTVTTRAQQTTQTTQTTAPSARTPERAADVQALRELVANLEKAFAAGKAEDAAKLFTEDAHVQTTNGVLVDGREAIQQLLSELFQAQPGIQLKVEPDSLRFLGPDLAIEEGFTISAPATGQGQGAPEATRYVVIYAKRDGRWLHHHAHEYEPTPDVLTPREHLRPLEWLVGEWVDESENAVVHITCRWAENGNYLLRQFDAKLNGETLMSGAQRIGWDPTARQIKSWVFEDDGGHVVGEWSNDGDRWVIKSTGYLANGQRITSTQIVTKVSPDSMIWTSVDRTVGGEALPEIDEIAIVRKPPAPGTHPAEPAKSKNQTPTTPSRSN